MRTPFLGPAILRLDDDEDLTRANWTVRASGQFR